MAKRESEAQCIDVKADTSDSLQKCKMANGELSAINKALIEEQSKVKTLMNINDQCEHLESSMREMDNKFTHLETKATRDCQILKHS